MTARALLLLGLLLSACASESGVIRRGHERACKERWRHTRALFDRLDIVRAARGESDEVPTGMRLLAREAVQALHRALGVQTGPTDHEPIVEALQQELERTQARCPTLAGPPVALQLLATDQQPRETADEALARAARYRRLRRLAPELAPNVDLRLALWCSRAFRVAAREQPSRQQQAINQCLFPLFEGDPRPYFSTDVNLRPTDVPWTQLRDALERRWKALQASRFAAVAQQMIAADRQFFYAQSAELPSTIDLSTAGVARGAFGQPVGRWPVVLLRQQVVLVDGLSAPITDRRALRAILRRRLRGSVEMPITVIAPPTASARELLTVARAARQEGVVLLYLGVAYHIDTQPGTSPEPRGLRSAKLRSTAWRINGIPISLRLMVSTRRDAPARDRPRRLDYDPRASRARLALRVEADRLAIVGRDGALAPFEDRELPTVVERLHRAYPDEQSIIVAPAWDVRYERLLQLVATLRRHDGALRFPALALLSPSALPASERNLGPVLDALAAIRVAVRPPTAIDTWAVAGLRRCVRSYVEACLAAGHLPASSRAEWLPEAKQDQQLRWKSPTTSAESAILQRCIGRRIEETRPRPDRRLELEIDVSR